MSGVGNGAGISCDAPMVLILTGNNTVKGVNAGNSAVGIFCDDLLITGAGSLTVDTEDAPGSTYGIRSNGGVTIESGTVDVSAGESTRGNYSESYGIYAIGAVSVGGVGMSPVVRAASGDSYAESCAIYGRDGISVRSGDVTAAAGYANKGYADGLLSNRSTIYIEGGKVTASSEGAQGGMSTGICANVLEISGGEVRATGGYPWKGEQQSAGIYTNDDINISGGTVYGVGLENYGDVSFGINSWRGDITISNDAIVYAIAGPASYSAGLSAERRYASGMTPARAGGDITIKDEAKVYASVSDEKEARVYSYGMFVGGNLLIEGNPYVESVAGRVLNSEQVTVTGREKRSFGIMIRHPVRMTKKAVTRRAKRRNGTPSISPAVR